MAPTITRKDVEDVAEKVGYKIPDGNMEQYVELLGRMRNALELVMGQEDRQPVPDFDSAPRLNIHFPDKADNPLNGWAWRFECKHNAPRTKLLEGKTICLKDNIAVAQVPCLLGTESFTGWTPVTDATIVTRLLENGATIVGKAVCENLSRGAVSVTAATGPVHNPYARGYTAGGSSSGTAALVASGAVDLGIGCDQGGSIRTPAALCGLYGFKATFGLVPYTGIASNDASLDFVGPMTRGCLECATMLQAIAGVNGLDDRQIAGTPLLADVPKYADLLREKESDGVKGLRIGILKEGFASPLLNPDLEEKFRLAVAEYEKLGATVTEVSVPLHTLARSVCIVVSKMGNHMGMLGKATGRRQVMLTDLFEKKDLPYSHEQIEKMNVVSKEGLMSGEYGWSQYPLAYAKAVNLSQKLKEDYDEVLNTVDLLVMPTTSIPSNPLPAVDATPVEHINASSGMLENTSPFNISGHPALAVPIGFVPSKEDPSIKVPASMQIVGKYWDEAKILQAAYTWERANDWKTF